MDAPFFSIIVPIYCVEAYLGKCVDSILQQSFGDFEMILVDDGSPDKCPFICDKYASQDSRIKVIHKKNGGSSDARNVGIEHAIGRYLLFVDSDDYYFDIFFLENISSVIMHSSADVVLYGCIMYDISKGKKWITRGDYNETIMTHADKEQKLLYLYKYGLFPGAAWIMAVKREIVNSFQLRFPLGVTAEDYYWVENVLHVSNHIEVANKAFYVYIVNRSGSITAQPRLTGVKGILYSIDDWIKKEYKEQGITNFMAQSYLMALMNYARIQQRDRMSIRKSLFYSSSVLKIATGLEYRLALIIIKITGPFICGKIIRFIYNLRTKR